MADEKKTTNQNEEEQEAAAYQSWPGGTPIYWRFESGSYWGQVKDYNTTTHAYQTMWSDGDQHVFDRRMVDLMKEHAYYTLQHLPTQYPKSTAVTKFFEDDGGWWKGIIVGHDSNHNYTIEWSDGRLELWNPLETVAMVQDAEHYSSQQPQQQQQQQQQDTKDQAEIRDSTPTDRTEGYDHYIDTEQETNDPKSDPPTKANNDVGNDPFSHILPNPKNLPPTEQGLIDFLKAIDGPEDKHVEEEQIAIYHGTEVDIGASSKKEVPIPVFLANSIVEWAVGIEAYDIKFAIRHSPNGNTSGNDFVEPHYIEATENNNLLDDTTTVRVEQGQFEFGNDIQYPTTFVLEFDNTYSWITGKTITYTVKVRPPSSLQRSARARDTLPLVEEALAGAQEEIALQQKAVHIASQQVKSTRERYKAVDQQVEERQLTAQTAQKAAQKAGLQRRKCQERLQQQHQQIDDHKLHIEQIDQQIRKLLNEKQARLKASETISASIQQTLESLQHLEADYQELHAKAERVNLEMCDLQIDVLMRDQDVANVEKARDKALFESKQAQSRAHFLRRLMEELKRRL